jgi:HAD superfamily hydrolase (TIGR01509 family)
MVKLIIFDLDGVLVDARELHYESLNLALASIDKKYVIDRKEHLATYDGLSTTSKLNMLSEQKNLPKSFHKVIWEKKQEQTTSIVNKFTIDLRVQNILQILKKRGYSIICATNSIRETAKLQLIRKGFLEHIDYLYSNEDVNKPKPHPEIYMRCMLKANVSPMETLIIEDSPHGRKGAQECGAHLCAVRDCNDLTLEKIEEILNKVDKIGSFIPKWHGGAMNILIPLAGAGTRFEKAGYTFPKPLVEVNGKPMIQLVIENLNIDARHIFIVRKEHCDKYNLKSLLKLLSPNCEVIELDDITDGAACTALLAKKLINNGEPLLLANSDQFIEWDSNQTMYSMIADGIDGGILTFTSTHPKWSFVRTDEDGYVVEVAEKNPISNIATVGVYFWTKGSDFVNYAEQMIKKNIRTNNEFYVCPVYNEAVQDGKRVKCFPVKKMWGLGTPEDLTYFLESNR